MRPFLVICALSLACAVALPALADSSLATPTCTDTDGGTNYSVRGTITGLVTTGVSETYTDECGTRGDERRHLIEYKCRPMGYIQRLVVPCPFDCAEGACLSKPLNMKQPIPPTPRYTRPHIQRRRNGVL